MRPASIFPAPRRIKSVISAYNSSKEGTLRLYEYKSEKGKPRPGWTYRSNRRNMERLSKMAKGE